MTRKKNSTLRSGRDGQKRKKVNGGTGWTRRLLWQIKRGAREGEGVQGSDIPERQ